MHRKKAIKRAQNTREQERQEWLRNRQQPDNEMKQKENDFLKQRRDNERKWQEQKEQPDKPVPRGVLLPIEDDWAADLNEDPNETDAERTSRRQREERIRRD